MGLRDFAWRIVQTGVGPHLSLVDRKHVMLTNVVSVVGAVIMVSWIPLQWVSGLAWTVGVNLVVLVFVAAAVELNRRRRHTAASVACWLFGFANNWVAVWLWGADTGTLWFIPHFIVIPFLIMPSGARRLTIGLAGLGFAEFVIVATNQSLFPGPEDLFVGVETQLMVNAVLSGLAFGAMALAFTSTVDDTDAALEAQRERSDQLLRNVLPQAIAERLKADPDTAIADKHDGVTVLFADIVGFTPLSERLSPAETVLLLNQVFTAFDAICARHGVEKIRTIGDGYMVVAGAPESREDHAEALTRAALEMRDYMAANPTEEGLRVRIGLNSGPAVAGIVGTQRFHYDVWGDAVNVAARMESMGEPGRVQVAEGTWTRIREAFRCSPKRMLAVKGKGDLPTWFVEERL